MKHFYRLIGLCVVILSGMAPARADVTLPSVLGDHMVLQRGQDVPVWGRAEPGETVTVTFADQRAAATADEQGRWRVTLAPMEASKTPRTMTIAGHNTLTLRDILVGEVWVCSGQSNMQWPVLRSNDAEAEIAAADYPQIRLFNAARTVSDAPAFTIKGQWAPCSPQSVRAFSAVGYFFGRDLYDALDVPIGLINTSWGGTPAEAWTSAEALGAHEETAVLLDQWEKRLADYPRVLAEWKKAREAEEQGQPSVPAFHKDPGNEGVKQGFAAPDFDDAQWADAKLPGAWEESGQDFDGVVWYRKRVELPAGMVGQDLTLRLGTIDDFDTTYVNGQQIGSTTDGNAWMTPRRYTVPAELTRDGVVTLAVRVFDHFGAGGFTGPPSDMRLEGPDGASVPLAGAWKMHVAQRLPNAVGPNNNQRNRRPPRGPDSPHRPANLYNGMIQPFVPFAIRGAIWYQGESNAGRFDQYRVLLPAMIGDWRNAWGQGEFPFGIVQLANFKAASDRPSDTAWARLREAQDHTAQTTPNAGLAVIIDIGEADDIHPRNKQDVGKRLARWALADVYGRSVVKSGPRFTRAQVGGDKITLHFDQTADGLTTTDGHPPAEFTIAGADGRFVWADARIDGDTVVVWSADVPEPKYVRYAWADNPDRVNLVNSEQLPAAPFRTDTFPMGSGPR